MLERHVKPENHYQVSLKLRSDEALAEAVELARAAVEAIEAVRAPRGLTEVMRQPLRVLTPASQVGSLL